MHRLREVAPTARMRLTAAGLRLFRRNQIRYAATGLLLPPLLAKVGRHCRQMARPRRRRLATVESERQTQREEYAHQKNIIAGWGETGAYDHEPCG